MHGIEESRLVERAMGGDRLAFSVLMERYRHRVTNYLRRLVHDHHVAQDLCQEVFLRVFESLPRLLHARAFKPWLFRIAFHIAIDHRRRDPHRTASLDEAGEPFEVGSPQAQRHRASDGTSLGEDLSEAFELVSVAMRTLPPATCRAIDARYRRGLSCREIAREMGWSLANAKVRLHRGRRAIRRHVSRVAPRLFDDLPQGPPPPRDGCRVKHRI